MMLFAIFSLLTVLAANMASGGLVDARMREAKITFIGAGGAEFSQSFPIDGARVHISKIS